MALTWSNPGEREVATAATFISLKGPEIHDGLGGASHFDAKCGQFMPPDVHKLVTGNMIDRKYIQHRTEFNDETLGP